MDRHLNPQVARKLDMSRRFEAVHQSDGLTELPRHMQHLAMKSYCTHWLHWTMRSVHCTFSSERVDRRETNSGEHDVDEVCKQSVAWNNNVRVTHRLGVCRCARCRFWRRTITIQHKVDWDRLDAARFCTTTTQEILQWSEGQWKLTAVTDRTVCQKAWSVDCHQWFCDRIQNKQLQPT